MAQAESQCRDRVLHMLLRARDCPGDLILGKGRHFAFDDGFFAANWLVGNESFGHQEPVGRVPALLRCRIERAKRWQAPSQVEEKLVCRGKRVGNQAQRQVNLPDLRAPVFFYSSESEIRDRAHGLPSPTSTSPPDRETLTEISMQRINACRIAKPMKQRGFARDRYRGLGRFSSLLAAAMMALSAAASAQSASPQGAARASVAPSASGSTANFAPNDPPGEWHSQARDYANTRFSPLTDINVGNVSRLKEAWTFSDGTQNGHEAAPLVLGDTMYLVTPFPNLSYALDLSKPGAPIKWSYAPNPTPVAIGKACCDSVNRGGAYANGKLIYNLLDMHTVAVDVKTGKEVWRTKMGDVTHGETMTMAPLVVGNKVYVGNSGGELGVWGWIAALDVDSGEEVWRAYSTGTDEQVKIGPDFKPFYSWMKGKDLGKTTWPPGMDRTGAGAVWAWISYDPETNLIYYGTSNPSPRVPAQRPGYNLWTSAIFARDATTGMAKWAYQFTPHDEWDYDGVNESVLIDINFQGKPRKALIHFDRNAFAYTMDRTTGEVLTAQPFAFQNWSKGIDLKTGMPVVVPEMEPKPNVKLSNVCPPDIGGKDWQPSAFSPHTGMVYAGIFNICMDVTDHPQSYIAGTPYDGMDMTRFAAPGGNWGEFMAWDPVAGKKVWSIKEKFMTMSGALATAGDVVFYGTADGWFRAVDAKSGSVLWSHKLGSGVIGQPMTYMGPDKQQYVAIYSGIGGAAMVSSKMPGFPPRGGTLYVFSIDGESPHGGAGQMQTEAATPGVRQDQGMGGKH